MIGKAATGGAGFRGLINYLVQGKLGAEREDRVAWREVRNLAVDTPRLVTKVMRSTASRSKRCETPVYHLVLSWRQDERPTPELMRRVADTTLADLKLTEHQALLLAHDDTAHKHLHLVINRVHPETGKAWAKSHDWRTIEQSIGRQAKELGFIFVPGRHNTPEAFAKTAKQPRDSELQMAGRRGTQEHLQPRLTKAQIAERRQLLAPAFEHARSWAELERALATQGIALTRKGQGLVLGDAGGTMKLSDLGKGIRLTALEKRFGETHAAHEKAQAEAVRRTSKSGSADSEVPPTPTGPPRDRPRKVDQPVGEGDVPDTVQDAGGAAASPTSDKRQAQRLKASTALTEPQQRRSLEEVARLWREQAEARLREEERQKQAEQARIAAEEAVRRRALEAEKRAKREPQPPVQPPAKPKPAPVRKAQEPPPAREASPKITERARDYEVAKGAADEADLAFRLFRAGLVTRQQLAHSVTASDAARQQLDAHKDVTEKIVQEVGKALKPPKKSRPKKNDRELPPAVAKKDKSGPER